MGIEEAKTEVDHIMEKVDSDGSGFIDYTEFLKASLDMKKVLNIQNLEMTFSMFDTDNSGKISATEIKRLLGNGSEIDEEVWREIIQEVDQNGDGEIDLTEFKELVLARM
jgi:calcium-dependent protein kinase